MGLGEVKIYLAGPMRGYEFFNFPAFDKAAARLRAEGHEVFSPADNDRKLFGLPPGALIESGDEAKYAAAVGLTEMELRRKVFACDMKFICEEAECIALLPNAHKSKGARAERSTGIALGLRLWKLGKRYLQ